jgi:hypothetical protein
MKAYGGVDMLGGISSKMTFKKIQTYRSTYTKDVYVIYLTMFEEKSLISRKSVHLCAVESVISPPAFLMS